MELTLEKIFNHLNFNPLFKLETKKDLTIAFAACGVFSVGMYYLVVAIRNYFTHRPSDEATDQDTKIAKLRDNALSKKTPIQSSDQVELPQTQIVLEETIPTEVKKTPIQSSVQVELPQTPIVIDVTIPPEVKKTPIQSSVQDVPPQTPIVIDVTIPPEVKKIPIQSSVQDIPPQTPIVKDVTIPPEVKKTLDNLFEHSPYKIDDLPLYSIFNDTQTIMSISRKDMTAPIMKGMTKVMKGLTEDLSPFIVIKVDCNLSDENINKCSSSDKEYYKTHRILKDILILSQFHKTAGSCADCEDGKNVWYQLERGGEMTPSFFKLNFTFRGNGSGPTNEEKSNFELVKTLLKTGQSTDTKGLIWKIPT